MKRRFFIKNFISFVVPIFIPILVLGSLSIYISMNYISNTIEENNTKQLEQVKKYMDNVLYELDTITLNFLYPSELSFTLSEAFNKTSFSRYEFKISRMINYFISSSANAKPYIHSIYIYFDNKNNRFLSSNNQIVSLDTFYDSDWLHSLSKHSSDYSVWAEKRSIKEYDFSQSKEVISLFKQVPYKNGVVVLNINRSFIDAELSKSIINTGQVLYISDSYDNILFSSSTTTNADKVSTSQNYVKTVLSSEVYNWNYTFLTPVKELYNVPRTLFIITICLCLFSLITGLTLAYRFTKQNYDQLNNIVNILESAEKGEISTIPPISPSNHYQYITQNILRSFIQQSYMKYRLKTLELIAMQAQINPHFLFNTLNSIYMQAISLTGKPNNVSQMIETLSDLLEYSLSSPTEEVLMSEEINHTKSYISIQQIRYANRFKVLWEYNDNVKEIKTIKFLLQPLVENAIYHGLKPQGGQGGIKIRILRKNNGFSVSIIDNGVGISKDEMKHIRKELDNGKDYSEHIGLFNTNRRLKISYGENYKMLIRSKENFGTCIYITVKTGVSHLTTKIYRVI